MEACLVLYSAEDHVSNIERSCLDVAIVISSHVLENRVDRNSALHLSSSSESSSSCRLPSASAESYISSRGDFHMTSADSIASEPYTRKKRSLSCGLAGLGA